MVRPARLAAIGGGRWPLRLVALPEEGCGIGPCEIHRRSFQALCYRGELGAEPVAAEA